MLKRSRDANYLRAVWVEAQKHFSARGKNYKQILHLIKKAAEANGRKLLLETIIRIEIKIAHF